MAIMYVTPIVDGTVTDLYTPPDQETTGIANLGGTDVVIELGPDRKVAVTAEVGALLAARGWKKLN